MTFVALLLVSPYIRPCLGFEAFLDGGLGLAQNRVDKTGSYDLEMTLPFPFRVYCMRLCPLSHVLSQCMPSIGPAVLSFVLHVKHLVLLLMMR